jgi:hypothetical protein
VPLVNLPATNAAGRKERKLALKNARIHGGHEDEKRQIANIEDKDILE